MFRCSECGGMHCQLKTCIHLGRTMLGHYYFHTICPSYHKHFSKKEVRALVLESHTSSNEQTFLPSTGHISVRQSQSHSAAQQAISLYTSASNPELNKYSPPNQVHRIETSSNADDHQNLDRVLLSEPRVSMHARASAESGH